MTEEAQDYTEVTEEVVLTRWEKIKQWIEIVVATKKVAMLVWGLVFAAGGSVVVGQATDTKPIRDAAVAMGLLQEQEPAVPGSSEEISNLQLVVFNLSKDVDAFSKHEHVTVLIPHDHPPVAHEHEVVNHPHPYAKEGHTHANHTHPELSAPVVSAVVIEKAITDHIGADH